MKIKEHCYYLYIIMIFDIGLSFWFWLQVGKSLLIKCLVKHYTKHNLPMVQGPITIVSGFRFSYYCSKFSVRGVSSG